MKVRRLDARSADFDAQFATLVATDSAIDREIERVAGAIVDDVKRRGDPALLEYTNRFDRINAATVAELEVAAHEMRSALDSLAGEQRSALETAAQRIRRFHDRQVATSWSYTEGDGTELGQRVDALQSVGLYVPGGLAAYPSSVLMNALPAQVAGVENIVMVVPAPGGVRNALVLAAASLAGVTRDIHDRWRAGGSCVGLWHADDRRGRQDRRSGQCVCCGRQAARVRRCRD